MPKKDRQKDDTPETPALIDNLLGNPKSRVEREDALNRLIQRSIAVIVGIIVVIIAGVLIYDQVVVPQLPVATVNGERITVGQLRNRVDFERALTVQNYNIRLNQLQQQAQAFGVEVNQLAQNDQQLTQWGNELQSNDILGNRVIDDMVNDLLIKQEFESRGLSVDDDQIEIARQDFFGFDPTQVALIGTPATATTVPTAFPTALVSPTPSATPLPTNTPTVVPEATGEVTEEPTIPPSPTTSQTEAFENYEESVEFFQDSITGAEASASALNAFWERQAIEAAVSEAVVGEIETALYANARHILVDTQADADEIIAALQAGESFALLAQARSVDTQSAARGGELGWQAIDLYVPEFAAAIRDGEIGALLGPVESDFGFHIIQVIDTEERDVDEATTGNIQLSRFNNWLEERRQENEDAENIAVNDNWPAFLD